MLQIVLIAILFTFNDYIKPIDLLPFSVISSRKEDRKVLLSRGQKYHVLKFYFVALDGVDRRYVNAKRNRQKKGNSRGRERKMNREVETNYGRCMLHGRYNRTELPLGLANPTKDILLLACSFHFFLNLKYRPLFSQRNMYLAVQAITLLISIFYNTQKMRERERKNIY